MAEQEGVAEHCAQLVGIGGASAPSENDGVFFFFQAEDGIRDYKVTGVQTCALPIFARRGGFLDLELPAPPSDAAGDHEAERRDREEQRAERELRTPTPARGSGDSHGADRKSVV